jgi:hypothetical protein
MSKLRNDLITRIGSLGRIRVKILDRVFAGCIRHSDLKSAADALLQ